MEHSLRNNQSGNYKYLYRILRYRHDNLEYVTSEKNYTARDDMSRVCWIRNLFELLMFKKKKNRNNGNLIATYLYNIKLSLKDFLKIFKIRENDICRIFV